MDDEEAITTIIANAHNAEMVRLSRLFITPHASVFARQASRIRGEMELPFDAAAG
jgi:hypothetical protein